MNTTFAKPRRSGRWTPLAVAAFVLGFMVWWPLGLAILAYIIWGGSVDDLLSDVLGQIREAFRPAPSRAASSGNAAFDAYRDETLRRLDEERRRLEEERREFEEFVEKLRQARDRETFERFMAERSKNAQAAAKGAKRTKGKG